MAKFSAKTPIFTKNIIYPLNVSVKQKVKAHVGKLKVHISQENGEKW